MGDFRVIVTGSRAWSCADLAIHVVSRLKERHGDDLTVVHGDNPNGADNAFSMACRVLGVRAERHPADWDAHGKAAGPIRNREMVEAGARYVLAFPLDGDFGRSRGTRNLCLEAIRAGIPVWKVRSAGESPVRVTLEDLDG